MYLDLACKQLCFQPGKGINRRNESTNVELLRTILESYTLKLCSVVLTIITSIHSLFQFRLLKTVNTNLIFSSRKYNQQFFTEKHLEIATRNERKLATLNKENCGKHPRSNLAQNSNVPRSHEDYITQVSEEIQGRVTKKLSQEFSTTENFILGALARLDDLLMNSLIQGHSGSAPETSRNIFSISQGTNEDGRLPE